MLTFYVWLKINCGIRKSTLTDWSLVNVQEKHVIRISMSVQKNLQLKDYSTCLWADSDHSCETTFERCLRFAMKYHLIFIAILWNVNGM